PAPASAPPAVDQQAEDAGDAQDEPPDVPKTDIAMSIAYDVATNTILLNQGSPTTLPAISGALGRANLLRELSPGEWLLSANLRVGKGAVLHIAGPLERRLKLHSDAGGFVWIKAFG